MMEMASWKLYDEDIDKGMIPIKRRTNMLKSFFTEYARRLWIRILVFPMEMLLKKLHIPKLMGLFLFLVLFYTAEYSWGAFFSFLGYSSMELQLVYTRTIQLLHWLCILSPGHPSFMGPVHCNWKSYG